MTAVLGRRAWRGYEPWAETVLASRREFMHVTRGFWLVPEMIPLPERDDVALLYRVCRLLDDDIDDAGDGDRARAALARWRSELHGTAEPRPLVAAFLAGAMRRDLPMECVDRLLEGMEHDLGPVRIEDDAALLRYCYRVAAAVGLLLARLVGIGRVADARVIDYAIALQISNVVFGVSGDARRDRVYLPATRLAAAGLHAEDVLAAPEDRRLLPVLRGLADLADAYYASALAGMSQFPLRYRHGVILFAHIYADLGRRAANGERIPNPRARMPVALAARHLAELVFAACDPRTMGLSSVPEHDAALHRAIRGWPGAET